MTTIYKTDLFFFYSVRPNISDRGQKQRRCSQTVRETFSHELILMNKYFDHHSHLAADWRHFFRPGSSICVSRLQLMKTRCGKASVAVSDFPRFHYQRMNFRLCGDVTADTSLQAHKLCVSVFTWTNNWPKSVSSELKLNIWKCRWACEAPSDCFWWWTLWKLVSFDCSLAS